MFDKVAVAVEFLADFGNVGCWSASANYVKLQVAARGFSGKPLVVKHTWKKRQIWLHHYFSLLFALWFVKALFLLIELFKYQKGSVEMRYYWRNRSGKVIDWGRCRKNSNYFSKNLPVFGKLLTVWFFFSILCVQKERMEKTIENVRSGFNSIRTGRANPSILDKIEVWYIFDVFLLSYM